VATRAIAVDPGVETDVAHWGTFESDIGSSGAHLGTGHTRKICFAQHRRSKAAVQCVVPEVQFRHRAELHAGGEVDRVVRDVHDELVCADQIEARNFVIRQLTFRPIQRRATSAAPSKLPGPSGGTRLSVNSRTRSPSAMLDKLVT
jgi:hypothetical protein